MNDNDRIKQCLSFIAAHPFARYPHGWVEGVRAEARKAGLLGPERQIIGQNCKPGIDKGIVYGADMEDVH